VIAELSGRRSRRRHEADCREILEAGPGRKNTIVGNSTAEAVTSAHTRDDLKTAAVIPTAQPAPSSEETTEPIFWSSILPKIIRTGIGLNKQSEETSVSPSSSSSLPKIIRSGIGLDQSSKAYGKPAPKEDVELERFWQEMAQIQEERARGRD
jgi:hypothetical protein